MRTTSEIRNEYERWLNNAEALSEELKKMDEAAVEDAFYRDLSFGTGGLRGVIGAGTNRMNVYTVAKASQGLANYINRNFADAPRVAVSFDSRILSDVFSETASAVFAANGIKAYIYPRLMPTPCLSYAVRALKCSAGVMITASHNPAKYNGYKVYGADGCQITTEAAAEILEEIKSVDIFEGVKSGSFREFLESKDIEYIGEDVYTAFIDEVKAQSVLKEEIDRNVAVVYSPLNGTGLKPVTRILKESGFTNITVVSEQEQPDGNFPTCPYPNPEIREAMELGLKYCEKVGADLLLATDPDCDRCGIAVKSEDGYRLLTGNETGLLLLDFICAQRIKNNTMPKSPVFVKTIVTSDLAEKIAEHYGVKTVNVLTGFKFIGEVIGGLEKENREKDYICGFEESYGYLTGSYVRDKDAVNAAFMICEMFAYYKERNISLLQKLDELYKTFGYSMNTLHSYEFDGSAGMQKMEAIMAGFRNGIDEIGGKKVENCLDYGVGVDGLPKSDVLKYRLEGGSSVVIRPSGTEPKLKVYISVTADDRSKAAELEKEIADDLKKRM
ncbi:MAG: phospho-sugar mutase [Oscillospiraceae bacterium]|nr:phospho-sugar mutase [Oscillospiraceae bacterium]